MAFNYYTIDSIKQIDASDVPEAFIQYYQNLSEEMKEEIRDIRPDLVKVVETEDNATDQEMEQSVDDPTDQNTYSEDDEESDDEGYSPVVEAWEDISIRAWQKHEIETSVLVCKVIPANVLSCRIHKTPLVEKQIKIKRANGAIYSILGKWCPECMDFFLYQEDIDAVLGKLEEYSIPSWIQPLEDTLAEWRENATFQDLDNETPIYVPDTWVDGQEICPIHPEEMLIADRYRKSYKDRSIEFEAFYCNKCKKIIMRNALAQKLDDDCGEIGIPPIEFRPLRHDPKTKERVSKLSVYPDYFIHDGEIVLYDFDTGSDYEYEQVDEKDTVVVGYSRSCIEEDHEAEDTLALIKVQEKKNGLTFYLVLIGYCSECEKYYIAKEDYELLAKKGRPLVTMIDETGSFSTITSGNTFVDEKEHLNTLERILDQKISEIEASPGFLSKYATSFYDDGALASAKRASEPLYKEIDRLGDYKAKPYGYRTDLTYGDKTETYYLGVDDIELDGNRHVISFNSALGRSMVNYRTLELKMNNVQWKVRRRRTFDIENEILYGFTEQSDEDVIFRSGITDSFLINVLNMRKKQHQLIDIISTIQENQNAIIDSPFKENLIVQGCAGSGKTMILLHRLSALKYNHQDFNFDNAVILTPSKNFNTHISGLASSLQLGHVDRYSIEEYYYMLLRKYDASFVLRNPIADEMNVNQNYVDFVYSDEFKKIIGEAYAQKMEELKNVLYRVNGISKALSRSQNTESKDVRNYALVEYLKSEILSNETYTETEETNRKSVTNRLTQLKARKVALSDEIVEDIRSLQETIQTDTVRASNILQSLVSDAEDSIQDFRTQIIAKTEEYSKIEGRRIVRQKKQKLSDLQKTIDDLNEQQISLEQSTDKLRELHTIDLASLDHDVKVEFLEKAGGYSSEIRASGLNIQKRRTEIRKKQEELLQLNLQIQTDEENIALANEKEIPESLKANIHSLSAWSKDITPKIIYEDIYQEASERANDLLEARTGKRYKGIRGTHRYDLYLQLLFALHFFGEKKGNNSFVCIDEGQDLAPNEYHLISQINNTPIINIYGDTNQLLKKRGISDWSLISGTVGAANRFTLNENYRNTNQITRFCNENFHMSVSLTGVDGHSVKEMSRERLESALANLKIAEERVALILPRSVKKKDKYIDEEQLPTSIKEIMGSDVGNGRITVVYVDEVKGVEFDRVYVVPNGMTQNEKYIAFTRALSELFVVYDDSLNQAVQEPLESHISNENKSARIKSAKPQIKKTGSITIGKMTVKRDKKEEEKREALRNKLDVAVANIVKIEADAIVSSYSKSENLGSLSSAVYKAAGRGIIKELRYNADLRYGEVCITRGYDLKCKYVIHAFAPKWIPEMQIQSETILSRTYQNIMECALEKKIRTLAIPSLSTGYNGFPKRKAAYIALHTVSEYVEKHLDKFDKITFIVQEDTKIIFEQLLRHIGKAEDVRVALSNCVKCNRRIRIRKKHYDSCVVDGFIPRYCSTCSKEVYEQRICEICGVIFDITYSEKDNCEQTGKELPIICTQCQSNTNIPQSAPNNTANDNIETQQLSIDNNNEGNILEENDKDAFEVYAFGEHEGKYNLVPYEGKLKFITEKKVTNMYIPQKLNGKEKRVPVSVVEEDHIIYITTKNYKAYRETLMEFGGISLFKV